MIGNNSLIANLLFRSPYHYVMTNYHMTAFNGAPPRTFRYPKYLRYSSKLIYVVYSVQIVFIQKCRTIGQKENILVGFAILDSSRMVANETNGDQLSGCSLVLVVPL